MFVGQQIYLTEELHFSVNIYIQIIDRLGGQRREPHRREHDGSAAGGGDEVRQRGCVEVMRVKGEGTSGGWG